MEDSHIIDLFYRREEDAILECEKRYTAYCRYIISNILKDREDVDEVLSDVFLKAWNTIPPSRPESLKSYLGMLSRQLALNRSKEMQAKKRNTHLDLLLDELEECIPDAGQGNVVDEIAFRDCLNRFLASLPVKNRRVFIARYWYNCSVSQIAKEYSLKQSHVTVLLMRTRKKLKEYLIKESFHI